MTQQPNEVLTGEIIPADTTQKTIAQFSLPDAKISEMKEFCSKIAIAGVGDKENYKLATTALARVKKTRTGIEAKRKELKEPFFKVGQEIDKEAKRLTAQIEPIEAALKAKIEVIDKEAERIESERRKVADQTMASVFRSVGSAWQIGNIIHLREDIYKMTPEQMTHVVNAGLVEKQRIDEEQAELARLRALAAQQEEAKRQNVSLPPITEKQNAPIPPITEPPKSVPPPFEAPEFNAPAFHNTNLKAASSPGVPNLYSEGFEACRKAVIMLMESDLKLTRQQWIDSVKEIKNPAK